MKYKIAVAALLTISLGLLGCASERYTQTTVKERVKRVDTLRVMKMQDVIGLSKAGVSDSLIIAMMDATDSWFKLSTQDVVDLKNAGVSEKVIAAMMQQPSEPADQTSKSDAVRYYVYPPYFWYGGYDPFWYRPSFSVRLGFGFRHPGYFHHGRFR
jgi:hypothetical protein